MTFSYSFTVCGLPLSRELKPRMKGTAFSAQTFALGQQPRRPRLDLAFLRHVHGGKLVRRAVRPPQRIDHVARAPASQHLMTQLDELLRHRQAQTARYACDDDQLALLTWHAHLLSGRQKFKVKS